MPQKKFEEPSLLIALALLPFILISFYEVYRWINRKALKKEWELNQDFLLKEFKVFKVLNIQQDFKAQEDLVNCYKRKGEVIISQEGYNKYRKMILNYPLT